MSVPPIPPPLEHLADRPFSFFPPILNVEHNEWRFRSSTWSEILVVNTKTGQEVWIPRRYVGELSRIDEPVMILGLTRELEYKAGAVWPHQRQVIEMPRAVNDVLRPPVSAALPPPVPVAAGRLESATESRISKLIGGVLLGSVLVFVLILTLLRTAQERPRITFTTKDQSYLTLVRDDDYHAIVRKLGPPAEDRWLSETGELQYRILHYPQRSYGVILMGTDRNDARYIGTVDNTWRVLHYVALPGGGSTRALLRGLKRF